MDELNIKSETKSESNETAKTPPPEDSGLSHNNSGNSGNSNFAQPPNMIPVSTTAHSISMNPIQNTIQNNIQNTIQNNTVHNQVQVPTSYQNVLPGSNQVTLNQILSTNTGWFCKNVTKMAENGWKKAEKDQNWPF